jgi:hypothetical protein
MAASSSFPTRYSDRARCTATQFTTTFRTSPASDPAVTGHGKANRARQESAGRYEKAVRGHWGADSRPLLPVIERALYLLFIEGYHGASHEHTELRHEAMRLTALLLEHEPGANPGTYALAALSVSAPRGCRRAPTRRSICFALRTGSIFVEPGAGGRRFDAAGPRGHGLRAHRILHRGGDRVDARAASCLEETDWRDHFPVRHADDTVAPSPILALNRAIAVAQSSQARSYQGDDAIPSRYCRLTARAPIFSKANSAALGQSTVDRPIWRILRYRIWDGTDAPGRLSIDRHLGRPKPGSYKRGRPA